jgi:hypothetical protein
LQAEQQQVAEGIIQLLIGLAPEIAPAIRRSPLLAEEDEHDAGHALKNMRAALRLREYRYFESEVIHDEGTFLGIVASLPASLRTGFSEEKWSFRIFQCTII